VKPFTSLTNRIFVASSALTVLAIGFAVYFVSARVTAEAERQLERGLLESSTIVDRHRTTLFEQFTLLARLIAHLPRLKAAVDSDDPLTVQPIAAEYRQMGIRSDLFVLTGRSGRVLASIGDSALPMHAVVEVPSLEAALANGQGTTFWPDPAGVLQVVTVPILVGRAPSDLLGTLSLGFLLDDRMAAEFKAITDSDIAFAVDGRIRAATLPPASRQALEGLLRTDDISHVALGDDEYVALQRPLLPASAGAQSAAAGRSTGDLRPGERSGANAPIASGTPVVIVLQSRTERLSFLRPIRTALLVTALAAVLLATILSYAVARTVTRPIAAITAAMRDMAATGDLTRKIALPPRGRQDEDARVLATTFNTLIDSIARFQREAAQRDRLSSLGRLSTVIAHEIRNPLMIIKASLRTLRRSEATEAEIAEAVTDVGEEVDRLNRIVNEVLDFARPIQFEIAPADVNAVCTSSAAAVQPGEAGLVRLTLDATLPPVNTDAERLRTALVNIVSNAVQAARAGDLRPGDRTVDLSTVRRRNERVAIIVRDRGAGIAPEILPHVFDPYFTTRRTGTGLGLAISKNIIEGLGGSIAVRSEADMGTEVTVELPL
jgi:signal transduction histidine kinase